MKKTNGISRRDFIKGVAAGAASATAIGLLGAGEASLTGNKASVSKTADGSDELMTAEKAEEITWSFEVPPEPVDESEIKETYTADIIVIGAGMSGLCAACSALDFGGDVILFSASSIPYARGGSNHAIGTAYQKEMNIDYTPGDARRMVKVEQTSGTYHMDKQKWAKWVNNSAESMDWMIEKMEAKGIHVGLEAPYIDPDNVIESAAGSHNFWTDEQPYGVFYGAPLCAEAYASHILDMGGRIDYNTTAQYLIRENDNTGRVSAVVALNADGDYVKYEANKGIIMATGDFSRNADMMAKYSPWVWKHFKDTLDMEVDYDAGFVYNGLMPGDGQKMGLWVGAAWQRTFPNPAAINGGASGPAHAVISNFWGINLDINGRRYMNECTNFAYGGMAVLQLPEETAFGVWDSDYAYTEEEWEPLGYMVGGVNGIAKQTPEEVLAGWDANAEAGTYYKADTIEELVDLMYEGYSDEAKATAAESIKNYSEYAKNGYDEEFQVNPEVLHPIETPPFYGTKKVGSTFLCVFGGLRTNDNLQVCDENDVPIEGLYNTGTMIGDFYANSYNFVLPGQNLGATCCTLSYVLGKSLAQM